MPPPAAPHSWQGPALHGDARFCNWPCRPGPWGLFPPWGPRGGEVPSPGFLCLLPGADWVTDYPQYSLLESSSLGDSLGHRPASSHKKKPWTVTPAHRTLTVSPNALRRPGVALNLRTRLPFGILRLAAPPSRVPPPPGLFPPPPPSPRPPATALAPPNQRVRRGPFQSPPISGRTLSLPCSQPRGDLPDGSHDPRPVSPGVPGADPKPPFQAECSPATAPPPSSRTETNAFAKVTAVLSETRRVQRWG